jgi:hypothetical protein
MLRPLSLIGASVLLAATAAAAELPVVYNGAGQPKDAPPAKGQPPVVINYPSAALQAQPAADAKLPTVVNMQEVAGLKPPKPAAQRAVRAYALPTYYDVNAVVSLPYMSAYTPPAFGYGLGGMYGPSYGLGGYGLGLGGYGLGLGAGYAYSPFGYGYAAPSYAFGSIPAAYSIGYTTSYAYWAQPRALPTAVLTPVGSVSAIPPGGVVWEDVGLVW